MLTTSIIVQPLKKYLFLKLYLNSKIQIQFSEIRFNSLRFLNPDANINPICSELYD